MKQFNLDEYLQNPSRKVVTRDGRNVKIHYTNFNYENPIIAEIEGIAYSYSFRKDGMFYSFRETEYDLFFAPEKHEGWVNLYKNSGGSLILSRVYQSKEDAKKRGSWHDCYVTTTKIEWEE